MTVAYPLHWPQGLARTKNPSRSKFRSSTATAINNLTGSLRHFAKETERDISSLVVSSNATLLNESPRDAGVAVYFRWDNMDCCIAVDRYLTVADNLQAIHHIIEAERTKMRHGGLNVVRAGFRGFVALPPPMQSTGQLPPTWRRVLFGDEDVKVTLPQAEQRYRDLAKAEHPDAGGNSVRFIALGDAIRAARQELKL